MCWQPAQPTPTFRSAESKDKGAAQVSGDTVLQAGLRRDSACDFLWPLLLGSLLAGEHQCPL